MKRLWQSASPQVKFAFWLFQALFIMLYIAVFVLVANTKGFDFLIANLKTGWLSMLEFYLLIPTFPTLLLVVLSGAMQYDDLQIGDRVIHSRNQREFIVIDVPSKDKVLMREVSALGMPIGQIYTEPKTNLVRK